MYRFIEFIVSRFMTRNLRSVKPSQTLAELGALFKRHDFNAFPVVEEGAILGIVTKFDFLSAFAFTTGRMIPPYDELMQRTVADAMNEAFVHVDPSMRLTRVLQLMVNLRCRSFPVLDEQKKLVGMISREDVMRALEEASHN